MDNPTPKDDEVLVRVRAASVNPYDWHFMRGMPYPLRMQAGLGKPKDPRLGVDLAGQVEAVGSKVTQFRPGDEVFGCTRGAFAEYACAADSKVVSKPANVSFEHAASVPIAGLTALQGLRRGGVSDKSKISSGKKVLINGAAGGVGTLSAFRRVLHAKGSYIMVGAADGGGRWMIGLLARLMKASVLSRFAGQKLAMIGRK